MDEPVLPQSPAPSNPSLREVITEWWNDSEKKHTVRGLGLATLGLLGLCLWLGTRPPEQVVTNVPVPVKARLVAIPMQTGDDLGSIGVQYGRTRIEMIGFNLELIERNTIRCGERKSGMCRRDTFGERELAFDAAWPGDIAYVIAKDAVDVPALASNGG